MSQGTYEESTMFQALDIQLEEWEGGNGERGGKKQKQSATDRHTDLDFHLKIWITYALPSKELRNQPFYRFSSQAFLFLLQ